MSARVDDNRIIHGLWIGRELSRLEQLTLRSFVRFGHEFHLWVYDEIETPLPVGVSLRDASRILPRERIFKTAGIDPETGVGRNAYPPFSDLFRYKLLYDQGGIWVDMDVTCLRRFDFTEEYLFRPHRLGMVGNVMKCPQGSELMRSAFEEVDAVANEDIAWLTPNRILNKHVERLELGRYIRKDISNEDHWLDAIRPFVESDARIPNHWYAIHWVNEFWRTLKDDNGEYRGRRVLDYIPDKDNPFAGSTLHELYRYYRLIDPWQRSGRGRNSAADAGRRLDAVLRCAPAAPASEHACAHAGARRRRAHGGRDRERLARSRQCLADRQCHGAHAAALSAARRRKDQIAFLSDDKEQNAIRRAGLDVLASPVPLLYTHLIRARDLQKLWKMGVATAPVVHNARPGWLDPPTAYNDPHVPFVIACADAVAAQLRESRLRASRHYLAPRIAALVLGGRTRSRASAHPRPARHRRRHAAHRHGWPVQIAESLYARRARAGRIRSFYKAKLMILGGWDHAYGSGRTTYEATMRQAVELGVVADVIVPGNVEPVDPYLGAFDIFLNTSVYEGLSISLLEAIQAGCPVVSANAGGNREVLPPNAVLVEDPSDIDAYVAGITRVMNRPQRILPAIPPDSDLVPRLWSLLAKYGSEPAIAHASPPSGTLFITQNLHVGGPARAIVNLLTRMPADSKNALCVLGGVSVEPFREALARAQIPLLSVEHMESLVDRAERILAWADQLAVRNICFWNAQPELKLLLSKVLSARAIRLVDVSPGPMLFDELAAAQEFQRRVSLSARAYVERLDAFVALYDKGIAEHALAAKARSTHVIPRGVALPPRFVPLPPAEAMLPQRYDPISPSAPAAASCPTNASNSCSR